MKRRNIFRVISGGLLFLCMITAWLLPRVFPRKEQPLNFENSDSSSFSVCSSGFYFIRRKIPAEGGQLVLKTRDFCEPLRLMYKRADMDRFYAFNEKLQKKFHVERMFFPGSFENKDKLYSVNDIILRDTLDITREYLFTAAVILLIIFSATFISAEKKSGNEA